MTEPLLSPISIGSCALSNRLVMTAASLCRSTDGFVTEDVLDFYLARVKGGAGLVVAGAAGVDPVRRNTSGMMQICDDSFLPGLSRLTQRIHQAGGKVFLQLLHTGAYAHPAEYGGAAPLAPSAYLSGLTRVQTEEMSQAQIREIVGYFAHGAARAKQAGFDGVELCGSVGYLIAEFLSSATNHRTDQYGGSLENRMRFLLEITDAVKKAAGCDYPLMVRLSGADLVPQGNTVEDFVQIGIALERHGVDAIDVTGGWHESRIPQITGHVPRGAYRFLSKSLKEKVSIPVIACNRMDLASGRDALLSGCCDLVGMCRPFIADPNLVNKLREGRAHEIHHCLSCNQECLDRVFSGKPVGCSINPFLGSETMNHPCRDTEKNILVIGAGISGLVYSSLACEENRVTVYEKSGVYGGAGRLLSQLPHWEDCGKYVDALYQECLRKGVSFSWYQDVSETGLQTVLDSKTYDKIVIAAGAAPSQAPFPIEDGSNVYSMQEFMDQDLPLGKHTVILGNDFRALEFALACAKKNRGNPEEQDFYRQWLPDLWATDDVKNISSSTITCIGPQRKPGGGMAKSVLWAALQEAKQWGLACIPEAAVAAVTQSSVLYRQEDGEHNIPADTVILAHGWQSAVSWSPELLSQTEIIGDAKAPGRITEAVRAAARAALL